MQGLCGKTLVAQKTILIVKMSIFFIGKARKNCCNFDEFQKAWKFQRFDSFNANL